MKAIKPTILLILMSVVSLSAFAEWVPLQILVDGVKIGDVSTDLDKSKANAIKGPQLLNLLGTYLLPDKTMRIQSLIDTNGSLSLVDLDRVGISSNYDEKELRLILSIPLEMRSVKDFPLYMSSGKVGLSVNNGNYSGYLNLRGLLGYTTQSSPTLYNNQKNPLEGQLELVQNLNWFSVESTGNYREFEKDPFHRVDSSIVHDFEADQVRLRVGDFSPGIQGFQSSFPVAGIQIQKQFNIYPDKGSINKRSSIVQVKTNSLMEVFINGNLVSRMRVAAGPYNLKDLPLLYGRNILKIILHDDFGGTEEFEVDMLYDDQILAKGVNDFSYQVGRPSYFIGLEKHYIENNFSSFYHRYGITDELTLAINHQNYLSSNLFGVGVGMLTGYGTHFLDYGYYSDETYTSSYAGRWRYNSPESSLAYFQKFRVFLGAEYHSTGFSSITSALPVAPNFKEKYDFLFQKQLTGTSSFSAGITQIHGQNITQNDLTRRIAYQNQFTRSWRFDVNYTWNERQRDLDQILLSLNWFEPDGKAQAAFAHDTVNNATSLRVNRNNRYSYNDLQLAMFASKQKSPGTVDDSQNMDLSANYYASKYEARVQVAGSTSGSEFDSNAQFGFGSALAWTTDSVSFSRPITDSFAILAPEGMKKYQYIAIPSGLERDKIIMKNDSSFVYSNLTSYVDTSVKLDSTGLGASSHLDRESYILSPKYRSGLYIPLSVVKALTVRGKLSFPKIENISYAYGRLLTGDGKVFSENFFTDESGNFVLDGLSYGKYEIELADKRLKTISFELVPGSIQDEDSEDANDDSSEYEMGTIKIERRTGR